MSILFSETNKKPKQALVMVKKKVHASTRNFVFEFDLLSDSVRNVLSK